MKMNNNIKVSVILPCLNEEESIAICIDKCLEVFKQQNISAEIIVVDNGSTDGSADIARSKGVRVVEQNIRGYGAAYLKGIDEACGDYIVMGDADDSYDFFEIPLLLERLDTDSEFVIGSRFLGKMTKGAMSFSHKYIGNPILTTMLNLYFKARISDAHSGFRAIKRSVFDRLNLKTTGMEFASEMIVAALREKVKIVEVPITYHPRIGTSKLNSMVDAWRHIRFMLLFSPDWLFLVPGYFLFFGGFVAMLFAGWGKLVFMGHSFDIHAMIFFSFFALLGFQIISMGIFAKTYGLVEGLIKKDSMVSMMWKYFDLEKGLFLGALVFLAGLLGFGYILIQWLRVGFGPLNQIKLAIVVLTFMFCGIQTIFSSFLLSLLGLQHSKLKREE